MPSHSCKVRPSFDVGPDTLFQEFLKIEGWVSRDHVWSVPGGELSARMGLFRKDLRTGICTLDVILTVQESVGIGSVC